SSAATNTKLRAHLRARGHPDVVRAISLEETQVEVGLVGRRPAVQPLVSVTAAAAVARRRPAGAGGGGGCASGGSAQHDRGAVRDEPERQDHGSPRRGAGAANHGAKTVRGGGDGGDAPRKGLGGGGDGRVREGVRRSENRRAEGGGGG